MVKGQIRIDDGKNPAERIHEGHRPWGYFCVLSDEPDYRRWGGVKFFFLNN